MMMPVCGNCRYELGDCDCGEWSPVYLNDCGYLKHKITGKVHKVAQHCGATRVGPDSPEYFIVNSKVPVPGHYPKRLIKYYDDYTFSSEQEYFKQNPPDEKHTSIHPL